MTVTYTPIASQTLTGSATSVTFSSIPSDYRDLILITNSSANPNFQTIGLTFNNDNSAIYHDIVGFAQNTTHSSQVGGSNTSIRIQNGLDTSGFIRNLHNIQILDYSATDKHKTVLYESNRPDHFAGMGGGRWGNTAAITVVKLTPLSSRSFLAGSTFSLYGVIS